MYEDVTHWPVKLLSLNLKILEGFKTSWLLQDIKRQNLSFILCIDADCTSILIVPLPCLSEYLLIMTFDASE